MRLVSGCIRPTPVTQLPVLSGILPQDIWRKESCYKLACRALANPDHLLHDAVSSATPGAIYRLKSRSPLSASIAGSLRDPNGGPTEQWQARWSAQDSPLRRLLPDISLHPPGHNLPRAAWVRLNRLRSGCGHFRATTYC